MADVFDEISDDLRREKLNQFWRENGSWIIGAAVLAVVLTGVMAFWRQWEYKRSLRSTTELYRLLEAADVAKLEQFGRAGPADQGVIALFMAAAEHLRKQEKKEALAIYGEIADKAGADRSWRDLARLLSVSQQLEDGEPAKLEKELSRLDGPRGVWRYTALELQALLAARQGQAQKAADILAKIAADPDAPSDARTRAVTLRELYAADAAAAPKS